MNTTSPIKGYMYHRMQGVTVLEMMVTIAVLAIILSIAIPSFQDWLRENELTADINRLQGSLVFARSEAVKRNDTVSVEAADGGWSAGWIVEPEGEDPIRSEEALQTNTLTCGGCGADGVSYRGDGSVGDEITFELCSPEGSGRELVIQPSGRPSVKGDVTC